MNGKLKHCVDHRTPNNFEIQLGLKSMLGPWTYGDGQISKQECIEAVVVYALNRQLNDVPPKGFQSVFAPVSGTTLRVSITENDDWRFQLEIASV